MRTIGLLTNDGETIKGAKPADDAKAEEKEVKPEVKRKGAKPADDAKAEVDGE